MMKLIINPKSQLYIILSIIAVVYWYTKPPSILWIDSGTMIGASADLGIPNPPGFPFYMVTTHIFSKIMFFLSKLESLQLYTLIFSIGLLFIVYKIIKNVILVIRSGQAGEHPESDLSVDSGLDKVGARMTRIAHLSALFGMLSLAFSYEYWSQTQNTEAFIPTYFFVALFLYLLLRYLSNLSTLSHLTAQKTLFKTLALIAFLYGLGSGMNPTIASLVPGVLFIMFLNRKFLTIPKLIVLGGIFALTWALVYSYLPIRASQWPFVNWGNPQTWDLFWGHLKGVGLDIYEPKSGSINGFTGSPIVFFQSVTYFALNSIIQFTPFLVPLIIFGIYALRKNKVPLILLLSIPLIEVVYSGIYLSGNQEAWFIQAWIVYSIFIGVGFNWAYIKLLKSPKTLKLLTALCLLPFFAWFLILNRHNHHYSTDYMDNLYTNLEQNAILIGTGDFFNSLSHYLHTADIFRPDVTPLTANVFYVNKWSRDGLRMATNLSISNKIDQIIQYKKYSEYNDAMNQFIDENINAHPIYVTQLTLRASALAATSGGQLRLDPDRFKFVPAGLVLKVVRATEEAKLNLDLYNFKFKSPLNPNPYYLERNYRGAFQNVLNDYVYAYEFLADYLAERKQDSEALKYYQKALSLSDKNPEPYAHLGEFYATRGDYNASSHYLEKAERLDVKNVAVHYNLGMAYINLGVIDKAILEFESVKKLSELGDPIALEADRVLSQLQSTNSISNQSNLTQTTNWEEITDQKNNFSIKIPPEFKKESTQKGTVFISNNQPSSAGLNIEVFGETVANGTNLEEYLKKSPLLMTGILLDNQPINLTGFNAAVQVFGTQTGESSQRFILIRDNNVWQFKVTPGNSARLSDFYTMLSTFKPL